MRVLIYNNLAIILFFFISSNVFSSTIESLRSEIYLRFDQGHYSETNKKIDQLSNLITASKSVQDLTAQRELLGFIEYMRAMTAKKLDEYDLAILHFEKAVKYNYKAKDLDYELAQSYYVSDQLKKARYYFARSVRSNYKIAVSLYYMGVISNELKEVKKAVNHFKAIEKLPYQENKDVLQAARFMIADIYLAQVEKLPNSLSSIEKIVIPQYESAYELDKESTLAPEILEKIKKLQQNYDLFIFQMRNGRVTAQPPYFLKANVLVGHNSNVNMLSNDEVKTTNDEVAGMYTTVGTFGRYSFYPNNIIAFAPEFRFNYTKFHSQKQEIFRNDNMDATIGLKSIYEHSYNKSPAALYLDIEYGIFALDSAGEKKLEHSSNLVRVTLSEEIQFWKDNISFFRIRNAQSNSVVSETLNNQTNSFIWEQTIRIKTWTLYLFNSFDQTRFTQAESNNTNSFTTRLDFITPSIVGSINPIFFISQTANNFVNNPEKGSTKILSFGLNLNRPVGKNKFIYLDISSRQQSGKLDSDNNQAMISSLNFDVFF